MANQGSKHLNSFSNDEHDGVEYRKRVATYVDGSSVSYEDLNFVTGNSPAVLNIFVDLGRFGHEGYLINDGPGDIKLEISTDGTTYGGQHTIKQGEQLVLDNLKISKIRLTWITDTAYRVFVA